MPGRKSTIVRGKRFCSRYASSLVSAVIVLFCLIVVVRASSVAANAGSHFEKRTQGDGTGRSIVYGLAKPRPFNVNTKYPMVIALHGMSPVAPNTLDLNKINSSIECNIWVRDDMQAKRPCFVVCPMTPIPTWDGTPYHSSPLTWDGKNYPGYSGVCPKMADTVAFPARCIMKAIDSLKREFPQIDEDRIYIVGGSMGGVGAYCIAVRRPRVFAALWQIAGLCDTARACSLKSLPLWAVHGTGDGIVSTTADSLFVKAIVKCGGNPRRSWIAGAGHGPFDHFGREEYHVWLFSQSRSQTGVVPGMNILSGRRETAPGFRIVFGIPVPGAYSILGRTIDAGRQLNPAQALRPWSITVIDEKVKGDRMP